MAEEIQKIKTVLIPESGIELEPEFVMESEVSSKFMRALAHIVGKGPVGSVVLRSTTDGRLLVAAAGAAFEIYVVESGTALDDFDALHTYDQTVAQYVTDILIETHPAIVSFRNASGTYGDEKIIPVGIASIEFIHYGIKIKNRTSPNEAVYEITMYR